MPVEAKICGLRTPEAVAAAVEGGARYLGFVFFSRSPRHVAPTEASRLAATIPPSVKRVGLVVDADDAALAVLLRECPLDILQLHGRETPDRVRQVRERFGLPILKALPISEEGDVRAARAYEDAADLLLFDAKPPRGATRPGGNALAFDWTLLAGTVWRRPWLLAGGLEPGNVAEAVRLSGARAVDVSSGVEDAPGIKNPARIRAFLDAVRAIP
ncbi:MAG: phosphoribosylanthranilate isomerase [Magnetospirillum sp. WYHS-4]